MPINQSVSVSKAANLKEIIRILLPNDVEIKKKNCQNWESSLEIGYLLDLCEVELERGVDPRQDLASADEVGSVHDPNVGGRCHCCESRDLL